EMRRWRAIIEKMAKVRSASRASYFIPYHPMTCIGGIGYFVCSQRGVETGPSSVGFKFRVGSKQRIPTRGAEVNSFLVIIPIRVLVSRFRFRLAQNLKLAGTQDFSPLIVAQRHLLRHRNGLDLSPDSRSFRVLRNTEARGKDAE